MADDQSSDPISSLPSESNRPESTNQADSPQDAPIPSQNPADSKAQEPEVIPPTDESKPDETVVSQNLPTLPEPVLDQAHSSEADEVLTNRPDSTTPADSTVPSQNPEETQTPASSESADTQVEVPVKEEAKPEVSEEKITSETLTTETSEERNEITESVQAEKPEEQTQSPQAIGETPGQTEPPNPADQLSEPPKTEETKGEIPVKQSSQQVDLSAEALAKEDIDVKPPDNQVLQVQSEPSDNTSSIQAEKLEEESASFNSEPPEQHQEAPIPDILSPPADNLPPASPAGGPTTDNSQPSSSSDPSIPSNFSPSPLPPSSSDLGTLGNPSDLPPPTSSIPSDPLPSSSSPLTSSTEIPSSEPLLNHKSFGDLLKEAQDIKANIPEDLFEIKDTPQEIVPPFQPPPPQNPSPQQSSQPDQTQTPQPTNLPEPQVIEKVVEKIVEKPVEKIVEVIKEVPVEKIIEKEVIKEVKVVDQEEINKQIADHTQSVHDDSRILANQARQKRRDKNLSKIIEFVKNKGKANNQDIRDLLHAGQSTVSTYLKVLVNQGVLKSEGKGKATVYKT